MAHFIIGLFGFILGVRYIYSYIVSRVVCGDEAIIIKCGKNIKNSHKKNIRLFHVFTPNEMG